MNHNVVINKSAVESVKPPIPDWLTLESIRVFGKDLDSEKATEMKQSLKFEWWDNMCDRDVVNPILTEKLSSFCGEEFFYSRNCGQSFDSLLKSCGRIISVTLEARGKDIEIRGDKLSFTTEAVGDCCSTSWFEAYGRSNFSNIVGKEVSKVKVLKNINYKKSGRDACDQNDMYTLTFTDESTFKFLFRNSSNGYYSGYINVVSCRKTGMEDTFIQNAQARVVIVIGLPSSGKTTFMKDSEYLFSYHDDCLFEPMFLMQLKEGLERGQTFVFNDPRLCELEIFQNVYNRVMRNLVSPSQIFIIHFDNNPQQCIRNLNSKDTTNYYDRRTDVTEDYINVLSVKYKETLKFVAKLTDCLQHKIDVVFAEDWQLFKKRRLQELGIDGW